MGKRAHTGELCSKEAEPVLLVSVCNLAICRLPSAACARRTMQCAASPALARSAGTRSHRTRRVAGKAAGGIGALASFLLMDRAGAAAFFGIYMKAAVVADSSRHVSRIGLVSPCTVIVSSHCGLYQLQCSVCAQSHKTRGPRKFHQNIKLRVL